MTSDSDALFSEASDELQEDVRENLADAEAALPEADDVWEVDSGNVIGVLNQLESSLDADDSEAAFEEARKWFLLGDEADAFSETEQEDFEARFERVQEALESMEEVRGGVDELIPKVPELKGTLESLDVPGDNTDDEDADDVDDGETMNLEETDDGGSEDDDESDTGAAESWDGSSDSDESADDQSSLA